MSRTESSAPCARASNPASISTRAVGVAGSWCAAASLTISATSSFWTPSCRSRSHRRRSSAKGTGLAARAGPAACIGSESLADSTSDRSARRSLAAARSARVSAFWWFGVLTSTARCPLIRSSILRLATLAPRRDADCRCCVFPDREDLHGKCSACHRPGSTFTRVIDAHPRSGRLARMSSECVRSRRMERPQAAMRRLSTG